ncbi:MAG TPA: heme-binding protein [Acetobacteraceae bacterium]|nr:heme-binding protein [Acetobacteraceae bacterium]
MEFEPGFEWRSADPLRMEPKAAALARAPNPLGPLAELPGTWKGHGFNAIWRPHQVGLPGDPPKQDRVLELNLTRETLQFTRIPGNIPNRGFVQPDIDLFGVTYLQQISDRLLKIGIHAEPGVWASVPATEDPEEKASVVRMASIPHGTTINAQGQAITVNGGPQIQPTNITPFVIGNPAKLIPFPETDLSKPSQFRLPQPPLLGEIHQSMVDNPNSVLTDAIKDQKITKTTVLSISTAPAAPLVGGGTDNIAFLVGTKDGPNADAAQMTAIFWIETVEEHGKPPYHQLQYTQTVLLNFAGLSWPHVSVATLRKV